MKFIILLIAFKGASVTTISNELPNVTTIEQCETIGREVAASMKLESDDAHFICHEVKK